MTREEILAGLKRLEPWFHRIDLGDGIYTKTETVMGEPVDHPHGPWQTIQKVLPQDLTGKTVLDVGCNAGFYCFEAKRRGASRVLGVDGQRQHVRQGLFVRKILDLDVEFRRMNVYELNPRIPGVFDITLALGLIYHLKHPILALENLYRITKELLIVETEILHPQKTPPSFAHAFGPAMTTLHPLVYVENPPEAKEQVFNWFLPSVDALTALLRNTGFDQVDVVEVTEDRAVVACRKAPGPVGDDNNLNHYVARLNLERGPSHIQSESEQTYQVRVENVGLVPWHANGENGTEKGAVHLGAHLLRADEEEVEWDYGRARLPRDVQPGEAVDLTINLPRPATPGNFIVEFDMVAEHVTWFEDHGSGTLRHPISVK